MSTSMNFGDKPPETSGWFAVVRNISLHREECNHLAGCGGADDLTFYAQEFRSYLVQLNCR
jgi:hypothetical protein